MNRERARQLRAVNDEVSGWVDGAQAVQWRRSRLKTNGQRSVDALRGRVVAVRCEGQAWRVLPLGPSDDRHLGDIAAMTSMPVLSEHEGNILGSLTGDAARALHDMRRLLGVRRLWASRAGRDQSERAASYLAGYRDWARAADVPALLRRLDGDEDSSRARVPLERALSAQVGLAQFLPHLGQTRELMPAGVLAGLPDAVRTIHRARRDVGGFKSEARAAGDVVRDVDVRRFLADMPVERLRDATRGRLNLSALTRAGIRTVQAVIERGDRLEHLPGIGADTAARVRGAAQTLRQTTYDEMPVRLDITNRTAEATSLLRRLSSWDSARKLVGAAAREVAQADALAPLQRVYGRDVTDLIVWSDDASATQLQELVYAVTRCARRVSGDVDAAGSTDPWDDFLRRPADYFAMLAELGFNEDEQATHGDLSADIVEAVRRTKLNTEYLLASLRGYQSFGARFSLVQRKVVIGDEMGLGKTVEAIAVFAHLRASTRPPSTHRTGYAPASWSASNVTAGNHWSHGSAASRSGGRRRRSSMTVYPSRPPSPARS